MSRPLQTTSSVEDWCKTWQALFLEFFHRLLSYLALPRPGGYFAPLADWFLSTVQPTMAFIITLQHYYSTFIPKTCEFEC
jgi:hypothetical protein